eukprot:12764145-Prorocentrum_lima.AAC.1
MKSNLHMHKTNTAHNGETKKCEEDSASHPLGIPMEVITFTSPHSSASIFAATLKTLSCFFMSFI